MPPNTRASPRRSTSAAHSNPQDLRGRAIVVPVMNMPSFTARSIYVCPLDGKNLNRVFPGNAHGSASEQIADWVFRNVISQTEYYVDLHGGDLIEALVPFTIFFRSGNERVDKISLEMAKVFGIHFLVCSETPGSTFCAASRAGIPSILAESGGQGIWTPEDVALHTNGLHRLMRHLDMIPGGAPEPVPFTLLERFLWLRSEHTAFWYPAVAVQRQSEGRSEPWSREGLRRARAADGHQSRRWRRALYRFIVGHQRNGSSLGRRRLSPITWTPY